MTRLHVERPKNVVRLLAHARGYSLLWSTRFSCGSSTVLCRMVTEGFSSVVQQQVHENNQSPQSSAEVKNEWSYTSIPHMHSLRTCRPNYSLHSCLPTSLHFLILITLGAGFRIQARIRNFSSFQNIQKGSWSPPSLIFNKYLCSFPGLKRQEIKFDQSLLSSADVKNEWRYTSIPPVTW